jgi:phosphoribosyl 1,2-cyclic phosphate phosphodiesterase
VSLKITILGCGNSSGVPAIGNYWGVCDPDEPRNRRLRCSLAVKSSNTTVVIDTGPDLSHQTTLFDIMQINGVFYTHAHGDHTNGICDLRSLFLRNNRQTIPCYSSSQALDQITNRFEYMFDAKAGDNARLYPAVLTAHVFNEQQYGNLQHFEDISYVPFLMDHGSCQTVGYRFGDLSYCADMYQLDDYALSCIAGSKIWIVDGGGYNNKGNPVHATIEKLQAYNECVKAKEVYLTCLTPAMDYHSLLDELPDSFYPAYDGLSFTM